MDNKKKKKIETADKTISAPEPKLLIAAPTLLNNSGSTTLVNENFSKSSQDLQVCAL